MNNNNIINIMKNKNIYVHNEIKVYYVDFDDNDDFENEENNEKEFEKILEKISFIPPIK